MYDPYDDYYDSHDDRDDDEADFCREHGCHVEDCADHHDLDDEDEDDEDEDETGTACYGCDRPNATTIFMEQNFCWPCYQSVAHGQHATDRLDFADPGSNSALRAAGPGNPRIHPCPNCQEPNRLTPQDKARGYQCDTCADQAERG